MDTSAGHKSTTAICGSCVSSDNEGNRLSHLSRYGKCGVRGCQNGQHRDPVTSCLLHLSQLALSTMIRGTGNAVGFHTRRGTITQQTIVFQPISGNINMNININMSLSYTP